LAYEPNKQLRTAIGFYNANDKANKDKYNGTDFVLDPGDNMLIVGEVGYSWNIDAEDSGMPGLFKIGSLYERGNRDELPDGERSRNGNYGFYTSIEQQVYREEDDRAQGLMPWAVVTYQPRQSINQLPVFFGAGLVYTGPIPTRDEDNTAIGFYYGSFSDRIDDVSSEKVLELAYTAQLTKWFYVRPDLQFIFGPAGNSHISNAIVAGGEIGVTF
jgi:porin